MAPSSPETRSFFTCDGVRLDADVYFPQGVGDFPVLLMRQPYGRSIASTVVYAHPHWYATQGYIVVIQDVRGRGTSQGDFDPFRHEQADGVETVHWAATLPGSSGAVGMYGFSYQGMTQLYAAAGFPGPLKTICPAMVGYDLARDWAYEGSAFCWQLNLAWALQLAAETARRQGDGEAWTALWNASRAPLDRLDNPTACLGETVLQRHDPRSFYFQWLDHPDPDDPYWKHLNPNLTGVDLPMLHVGGWFDPFLRGDLRLYRQMVAQSSQPQRLWIGPWAHLPWGTQAGAKNYGPAAQTPIDALQIRWFNQFLKGHDEGFLDMDPVHGFDLGTQQWWSGATLDLSALDHPATPKRSDHPITAVNPRSSPSHRVRRYFLASNGLAPLRQDGGQLIDSLPDEPQADWLVHDPWRPVPALGGHNSFAVGSLNRQALDDRTDVITYTTAPFSEPWQLRGIPQMRIFCTSDAPSFDLSGVLSVVDDAQAWPISQGYRRILAQEHQAQEAHHPWVIPLQAIVHSIFPGQRLRLSISAACIPAYHLNPGTGGLPQHTPRWQARTITLQIHSGDDRPSSLDLPQS